MSALREILCGKLANKLGNNLTMVESPGENTPVLHFIRALVPAIRDKPIYRRGNVIVLPDDEGQQISICRPSTFRSWLDRYVAAFRFKTDKDTGETQPAVRTITRDVAEMVLTSADFWPHVNEIVGLNPVARPSIASSSSPLVLQTAGYDKETQTLTFESDLNGYDQTQTLRQATDFVRELFCQFPFSDWVAADPTEYERGILPPGYFQSRSQSVQVAAMLSQFAINCVPRNASRMAFVYNANAHRSGKSLLCKIAVIPVNGSMASQSYTSKDDDMRKVVDAEMIRASSYLAFDNVKTRVDSQVIEGLMTAVTWTGRILGRSEMFNATNTATLYFTGNQIMMSGDLQARCLFVDLRVEEANAQERRVDAPIDDSWLMKTENRRAILTALNTIVREWDKAGRPKPKSKPRLGFEQWCDVIAGMVEFSGFGDCLAEPKLEDAGDNEEMQMNAFVHYLAQKEVWVTSAHADKLGRTEIGTAELPGRLEYSFQELADLALNEGHFDWILEGEETNDLGDRVTIKLNSRGTSRFAALLRRYAPTKGTRSFPLAANRRVRFSCTGQNRARRYVLDL